MIRISAAPIRDLPSLRNALQSALKLEFFTIPPYLTALYSLTGTSRGAQYARSIIRNVVRDEMLHMNLVCNILNAIGGDPDVRAAVPAYPNPIPMSLAGGLEVRPDTPLDLFRTADGGYVAWFTLRAGAGLAGRASLVQVTFVDRDRPVHGVMFDVRAAVREGAAA